MSYLNYQHNPLTPLSFTPRRSKKDPPNNKLPRNFLPETPKSGQIISKNYRALVLAWKLFVFYEYTFVISRRHRKPTTTVSHHIIKRIYDADGKEIFNFKYINLKFTEALEDKDKKLNMNHKFAEAINIMIQELEFKGLKIKKKQTTKATLPHPYNKDVSEELYTLTYVESIGDEVMGYKKGGLEETIGKPFLRFLDDIFSLSNENPKVNKIIIGKKETIINVIQKVKREATNVVVSCYGQNLKTFRLEYNYPPNTTGINTEYYVDNFEKVYNIHPSIPPSKPCSNSDLCNSDFTPPDGGSTPNLPILSPIGAIPPLQFDDGCVNHFNNCYPVAKDTTIYNDGGGTPPLLCLSPIDVRLRWQLNYGQDYELNYCYPVANALICNDRMGYTNLLGFILPPISPGGKHFYVGLDGDCRGSIHLPLEALPINQAVSVWDFQHSRPYVCGQNNVLYYINDSNCIYYNQTNCHS